MLNEINNALLLLKATIIHSMPIYFAIIVILFSALILNIMTQYRLSFLGIIPRHWQGLPGVVFAPFLHANFNHLFFNLMPLLVLTTFILAYGVDFYWNLTWILIIYSGLITWLFARPGIHIGASGLITAYWGFLVIEAYINHNVFNVAAGFVCVYYFMGIFVGIFPSQDRVSWEGHLFGLIAGITTYLTCYNFPFIGHLLFPQT